MQKVNHRNTRQSEGVESIYILAQLEAIWVLQSKVNHFIGSPPVTFMDAAARPLWTPLANLPQWKTRLKLEICENFPMLEEAFQQAEVKNDKI